MNIYISDTVADIGGFICLFLVVIILIKLCTFIDFLLLRRFDKMTYMFSTMSNEPGKSYDKLVPRIFMYKDKEIMITTRENFFEKPFEWWGNDTSLKTYHINGNPVACMFRTEALFHTKRFMHFNDEYNTNEFYVILRHVRKQYKAMERERFRTNYKNYKKSGKSMY